MTFHYYPKKWFLLPVKCLQVGDFIQIKGVRHGYARVTRAIPPEAGSRIPLWTIVCGHLRFRWDSMTIVRVYG